MTSPNFDTGTNAKIAIGNWSSNSTFSSTASVFQTSGTNQLVFASISYQGMATVGGHCTAFSIAAGAQTLNLAKFSSAYFAQGINDHFQTIEFWIAASASQFNVAAGTTTCAATFSQTLDDACVGIGSVQNLFSLATPFDPNANVPKSSMNSTSAGWPVLNFSTTNAHDLLVYIGAVGDPSLGIGDPTGYSSFLSLSNGGGTRFQFQQIGFLSVSSPQSGVNVQGTGAGASNDAGSMILAFTGDASSKPFSRGAVY